jgi:capsular exopolysaccharide synthesis family protein
MTVDPSTEDELQLGDYLAIMRRRWIWITLTAATVIALAATLTIARGQRFSATAQVGLGDSAAQEAIRSSSFTNVGAASRELSNEVNLALSDAVTSEVESQLGLEPSVTIVADTESDALRFEAEADTAEAAALHANTWAQVYVDTKRRQATASINEAVDVFQRDLARLREERQQLREPVDELEDEIAAASTDEQRALLQIQRDRLSADLALELDLLDIQVQAVAENITSLELTSRLASTGTARIVQVAAPPQNASSGSMPRNLVLGSFVGLVLGAVVALMAENLDRTIKSTEDVAALGIPVLGGIPAPGRGFPQDELPLATMRHTETPVAEGYQKVRTAVEFALLGRQINSLLITSPNQSEGKTTLSVNLAWAMSAVDHRVALVDVDFRRPRVHEIFNCDAHPGLSDNLLSGVPLPQLALRVDEAGSRNLIMMPTGTRPPSPANFVASPAFSSLIRRIEAEADLVILDAPPVLPVSDAPSIGRQVDAVIVAVKAGSTTRDQLVDTLDDLRAVGAEVIGVCVVGLKKAQSRYGNYDADEPRSNTPLRSKRQNQVIDVRDQSLGAADRVGPDAGGFLIERSSPNT